MAMAGRRGAVHELAGPGRSTLETRVEPSVVDQQR